MPPKAMRSSRWYRPSCCALRTWVHYIKVSSRRTAEVADMNSTRWALCAALFSCLALGASGCKQDQAGAADAPRPVEKLPGIETADPPAAPATGPGTSPAAAEPAAQSTTPPADTPSKGGAVEGSHVVALGSGGKSKVVGVGARTIADTPTYQ